MEPQINEPQVNEPKINRKTKYYNAHKNEPEFQKRIKEAKHRYYLKNREMLIEKALSRYYAIKELIQPQI